MSNDCARLAVLVEKLADDEASGSERRRAEAHLQACASCRDHLSFLTALHEGTRGLSPPEPPAEYFEQLPRRVVSRIGSESPAPGRGALRALFSPGALRWPALAATLLVLAAVGITVYRGDGLRPEQEVPAALAPPEPPRSPEAPAQAESARPPMARDERPGPRPAAEPDQEEPRREDAAEMAMEASGFDKPSEGAASPSTTPSEVQDQAAEAAPTVELRRARERTSAPESGNFAVTSLSAARAPEDCGALRRAAAVSGGSGNSDLLHRIALCALREHENAPGDGTLALAIEDTEKFLAVEPSGPRAEEVREKLERARSAPR